ncbi:phage tail protein [Streptomyces tremellae]|uniref:Major tail protein n=1 Tax=Streptomyces tremellae TaxID=1124239 RepID=A0ABP7F322_9ACTN
MGTPTPPPFDQVADLHNELIRKALSSAILAADLDTPPLAVADLFDTDGNLKTLPEGYLAIGLTTDDGITFSSDLSISNVTSAQSVEPSRSDVDSDTLTAQFVPQETRQAGIALYEGLPLATLGDVGTQWTWDRPATPLNPYRRLLFIALDYGDSGLPIYVVKHLPRARLTDRDDEQWARSDETNRSVTLTAYRDSTLGTSCRNWVDGPGWRAMAAGSGGGTEDGGGA